jgi:hypothetical protein
MAMRIRCPKVADTRSSWRWRWPSSSCSGYQKRRLRPRRRSSGGTPTRYTNTLNTDTLNTNNRSTNRTTDVVTIDGRRDYGTAVAAAAGCSAYVVVRATSTSTSRPSVTRPGRLWLRPVAVAVGPPLLVVDDETVSVGCWRPLAHRLRLRLRLRPTWYAPLVWDLQPRHRRGEGGSLNGCTTATMPARQRRLPRGILASPPRLVLRVRSRGWSSRGLLLSTMAKYACVTCARARVRMFVCVCVEIFG